MRSLMLELDDRQWSYVQGHGEPADFLRSLLDEAIRDDVVERALRDEHHVDLMIRRRAKILRTRFQMPNTIDGIATARTLAEQEVFASCATVQDPAMRCGAERLRLRLEIERGLVENETPARTRLQRLREQRPGLWREVLAEMPS